MDLHARRASTGVEEAAAWIERYHLLWSARFEALDTVIEALKRKEEVDGRKKRH